MTVHYLRGQAAPEAPMAIDVPTLDDRFPITAEQIARAQQYIDQTEPRMITAADVWAVGLPYLAFVAGWTVGAVMTAAVALGWW